MKFEISLLLLLFAVLTSCRQNADEKTEPQLQTDKITQAEPLKDTNRLISNIQNKDSLKEAFEKRELKKRINDSLKTIPGNEVEILAYYFHPAARCVTCRNIEAYSFEAVQQWEKANKKKVMWAELNIEDSVNVHYRDQYSLEFSSLIIVKYTGGIKDKWKNLEDTWKLVNNKSEFIKYVTNELNELAEDN
jgi:hypothetical protein